MPQLRNKSRKKALFLFLATVIALVVFFGLYRVIVVAPNTDSEFVSPQDENNKVETSPVVDPVKNISFVVGGDMMFDRGVDYKYRGDKIFSAVSDLVPIFANHDLSIVNLEGPISPSPIPLDRGDSMIFNFPPTVPDVLNSIHVNAVSLANNHTHNAGLAGVTNTKNVLTTHNIVGIGDEVKTDESSVAEFQSSSDKIAVITINCLESTKDITSMIKYEKTAGYHVLVFPHWGVEYQPNHTSSQQALARSWIDAGADMVIGSHPHVVEDAERYKGKPIFYSLGNLLFDQTFSAETQRGLVVTGDYSAHKLNLKLVPIVSKGIHPAEDTSSLGLQIKNNLIQNLGGSLEF